MSIWLEWQSLEALLRNYSAASSIVFVSSSPTDPLSKLRRSKTLTARKLRELRLKFVLSAHQAPSIFKPLFSIIFITWLPGDCVLSSKIVQHVNTSFFHHQTKLLICFIFIPSSESPAKDIMQFMRNSFHAQKTYSNATLEKSGACWRILIAAACLCLIRSSCGMMKSVSNLSC